METLTTYLRNRNWMQVILFGILFCAAGRVIDWLSMGNAHLSLSSLLYQTLGGLVLGLIVIPAKKKEERI